MVYLVIFHAATVFWLVPVFTFSYGLFEHINVIVFGLLFMTCKYKHFAKQLHLDIGLTN